MDLPRKSILCINNLELVSETQIPIHGSLTPSFPIRKSIFLGTPEKKLPRSSIQIKMKRLQAMQLCSSLENNLNLLSSFQSTPKPNICISELWGTKEAYLKKTGYLQAYHEIKKQNELEKNSKRHNSKKIQKPYVVDLITKTKAMNEGKHTSTQREKLPIIFELKKKKKLQGGIESRIDFIIKKCHDLTSSSQKFKLQAQKMKKNPDIYLTKKSEVSAKSKDLSTSTSQRLLSSYKG